MTQIISSKGYQLDWLKVQLTHLCNFSCSFCSQKDWASSDSIDLDALNNSVLSHLTQLRLLIITGGEPIAKFDLLNELTKTVSHCGTEVGIFSNLSLLTPQKALELRDSGVSWYRTTLNGGSATIHEQTYPNGSFKKTLSGIDIAINANTPVKIRCTVCKSNVDNLYEIIKLAYDLGINEVDFRPYLPLGDCNPHSSHAIDPEMMIAAAANLLHLRREFASKVKVKLLPNWFDFLYRDLAGEPVSSCELCHCGRKYIYIDADGNYRSCAGHRAILGSIFSDDIKSIWNSGGHLDEAREYEQDEYCNSCPRKIQCHGSNCHLVNYEVHGRFNKVNPTCPSWVLSPENSADGFNQVRGLFSVKYNSIISTSSTKQKLNSIPIMVEKNTSVNQNG